MDESDRDGSATARVFYLDIGRRILETRDITYTAPIDLVRQLEPELDRCTAIEVWQDGACVMCLKAHGSIERNCGKTECPPELKPVC